MSNFQTSELDELIEYNLGMRYNLSKLRSYHLRLCLFLPQAVVKFLEIESFDLGQGLLYGRLVCNEGHTEAVQGESLHVSPYARLKSVDDLPGLRSCDIPSDL